MEVSDENHLQVLHREGRHPISLGGRSTSYDADPGINQVRGAVGHDGDCGTVAFGIGVRRPSPEQNDLGISRDDTLGAEAPSGTWWSRLLSRNGTGTNDAENEKSETTAAVHGSLPRAIIS